tara:strand:+ start:40 stop:2301 length:2262 start_codon:yes stop_codon:yes gene_type:complete
MDQNTFFTDKNKDLIYTICRDEIQKQTQYNIDNNRKYYKTFGEIMKIIYKHSNNSNDLTELNNKTIGKTIPYITEQINKKKTKEEQVLPTNNILNARVVMEDNIGSNNLPISYRGPNTTLNRSVEDNFNTLVDSRRETKSVTQEIDLGDKNNKKFETPNILLDKILKERDTLLNIDSQHMPNQQQSIETLQNNNMEIVENNNSPIIQQTLVQQKKEEPKINFESYDLNNNLLSDLYGNADLNTYNLDNDKVDAMKLFEQQMNERTDANNNYRKTQLDARKFEEEQRIDNQVIEKMNDVRNKKIKEEEIIFKDSLSKTINTQMNDINIDKFKSQIDKNVEKLLINNIQPPTANDLLLSQSNRLKVEDTQFENMKKNVFNNKKYINRENLLIINSGDRDWFNESEDRYSFQVRFKPTINSYETIEDGVDEYGNKKFKSVEFKGAPGLGVDTIYKNIVSFEMIRVLMAIENIIIPFDNRIFIDYKSLPYIALKIDELQPLYSGTNSRINNTFAKLLFDKDHTNEVIINPKDSDANNYNPKYSRQFKRGYSSMAPMSNEKKIFYPSPLSTLNRLTISLLTPYGENIKNHTDVLEILEVNFLDRDIELELQNSTAFPMDKFSKYYLEITTNSIFCNKIFKIGDNIKFKGFICVEDISKNKLETFINRETGHYIINLEKEISNTNEGYITKFYISPPGEIDYKRTLATIINDYNVNPSNNCMSDDAKCKIINQSIQTHYVFKIITREEDITQVINAINI